MPMNRSTTTAVFLLALCMCVALPSAGMCAAAPPAADARAIAPIADTPPGGRARCTLQVDIALCAFVFALGRVTYPGGQKQKLPLQFKFLFQNSHDFSWDISVPDTASGAAAVNLTVVTVPGRISVMSAQFTVTGSPVPADRYAGSDRCLGCHTGFTRDIAAAYAQSGHAFAMNTVSAQAPQYPSFAPGVPEPPAGYDWDDVTYVFGGYGRYAAFSASDNATVITGAGARYNLPNGRLAAPAGFAAFAPDAGLPACTACHATGYDAGAGTWQEPAVGCEGCHGPGSKHAAAPAAYDLPDDPARACVACHDRDSGAVLAAGGLIVNKQQAGELAASPKSFLRCASCHDGHASARYDALADGPGVAVQCADCHADVTVGLSMQALACTDCHMPAAVQAAVSADVAVSDGTRIRLGDMRSHIFKIDAASDAAGAMFAADGASLALDGSGKSAGLTLDFACQSCHRPGGRASSSYTYGQLKTYAPLVHAP